MRWFVVLVPAVAGVVSLLLSPNEDFRSSGLLAGVAVSIVLVGGLLVMRAPWRERAGAASVATRGGVALVLVVGLLGLAGGLPEFFQERLGWWLSADDRGLLAVAPRGGGFVAVGHPETGAAWTSQEGAAWTQVRLPAPIAGLELRALAPAAGTLWAVAETEGAGGLLVEVAELEGDWPVGTRFAHPDHGQRPTAAAELDGQLLAFGSTYGNDVIFFRGDPRTTLVPAGPEPAGDRGYEARNMACTDQGCVAVGSHWEPAAAFWHTTDGHDWARVHLDERATTATGVASTVDGWLAVGHSLDGTALAWRSSDGRTWQPDPALGIADALFEGVVVLDGVVTAYGHHTDTDLPALWTLDGDNGTAITLEGPPGSRIRHVAASGETTVGVGVDGDSLHAATWVATSGSDFRFLALEPQP